MKALLRTLALVALATLPFTVTAAEPEKPSADKTHKVVFEVAIAIDSGEKWQGALRNVENTRKELGAATKTVVVRA